MPLPDPLPASDPYSILGVGSTATRDEIETAFRAAAKRQHPDTTDDPSGATLRMQRLNLARATLTDAELRRRYDEFRDQGGREGASPGPSAMDVGGIHEPWVAPEPYRSGQAPASTSSVMPAVAAVALMVLLGTVLVGIGSSVLTVAAFALALMVVMFAGLIALLGALR